MTCPPTLRCVVAVAALLVVPALPARAGVASPSDSYVAPRLVSCPAGDSSFVVIPRHISHTPWCSEGPIQVSLCSCTGYHLSAVGDHPYRLDASGCVAAIDTCSNGNGEYEMLFPFAGGGLCPGDSIRVDADGVWLGYTRVASFDQDGDLVVNHTDVALVQSKLGTADLGADFDGDGFVTSKDLALVELHLGHHAPDSVTGVPTMTVSTLSLSPPMPNPFRAETRFTLTLTQPARVDLALFDVTGRRVVTLFDGRMETGPHSFVWGGRSSNGARLMNGIYFLNAVAGQSRILRRTVFVGEVP
jgi:hypothetical protein